MASNVAGVVIFDQQRVLVDAFNKCLPSAPGFRLLCCTNSLDRALQELDRQEPDVLVLDADLPLGATFDAAHNVRCRRPNLQLLFLASRISDRLLDQALRVRSCGVVLRSEPLTEFIEAIAGAARGEFRIPKCAQSQMEFDPDCQRFRLRIDTPLNGLTRRQIEILRHLAKGDSVKTVARKLLLSPKSVDNQKFRIMHKLGVRDKVSLALLAVREGLIEP